MVHDRMVVPNYQMDLFFSQDCLCSGGAVLGWSWGVFGEDKNLWKHLWKLMLPLKCLFSLWKCLHKALPVGLELKKHTIVDHMMRHFCQVGGSYIWISEGLCPCGLVGF